MTFVGYKQILTSENETSVEELRKLIQDYYRQPSYYFLRWKHQVSGILDYLPPEFPSPEGQMFNADLELRWKQNSRGYQVLLLSQNQPKTESEFIPIKRDWITCDRNAYLYDPDETKFPQGFTYKDSHQENLDPKKLSFGQRYFQDAQTSTVHFVALTTHN